MTAAILVALMAQAGAAGAPPAAAPPLPGPSAPLVAFEGEVRFGQRFERAAWPGLTFRLIPIDKGWDISVRGAAAAERDFVSVATPPYRFDNARYLAPVYGRTAEDTVRWTPRRFAFVVNEADRARAEVALGTLLWPAGHPEAAIEAAGQTLLQLPRGTGELAILEAAVEPTGPGAQSRIARLKFRVVLRWPIDPLEALRHEVPPDACPGADPPLDIAKALYHDFDHDGDLEVAVLAFSCLAGTGGADLFAVLKRLESGAVVRLPLDDSGNAFRGRNLYQDLRGKMDVELVNDLLVQRFPVYREGDPNCCPTGGLRRLFFRWNGTALALERVEESR